MANHLVDVLLDTGRTVGDLNARDIGHSFAISDIKGELWSIHHRASADSIVIVRSGIVSYMRKMPARTPVIPI